MYVIRFMEANYDCVVYSVTPKHVFLITFINIHICNYRWKWRSHGLSFLLFRKAPDPSEITSHQQGLASFDVEADIHVLVVGYTMLVARQSAQNS